MIKEQVIDFLNQHTLITIEPSLCEQQWVPEEGIISGVVLRIRDDIVVVDRSVQAEHQETGEDLGVHWRPVEVPLESIMDIEPANDRIICIKVKNAVDLVRYFS